MKDYSYDFANLKGGYRVPFNPLPVLRKIELDPSSASAWDEAWENLYHQDDVDEASYVAVILLADIFANRTRVENLYNLVCAIEVARHKKGNPRVPKWLSEDFRLAFLTIKKCALEDLGKGAEIPSRLLFAAVAASNGEIKLAASLSLLEESDYDGLLNDILDWDESYQEAEEK